jgi:hypothetical protein
VEKIVGSYQCGFREGKSMIDQLQTLRQILEKTREHKISTFQLFIDYKAAYDSIRRDKLLSAMEEFEIPNKLINLTRATLKRVRCRVKIQKDLSDPFITERGLRQGDTLACLLFNIALEKVVRDSGIERRGTIYHKSVQVLAYADDLDIIGRSERAVREAFTKSDKEAQLMGLWQLHI